MKSNPNNIPIRTSKFVSASLSLMATAIMGFATSVQAQTYSLSNIWAITGTSDNLDTSADNRGMVAASISNGVAANIVLVNNKSSHVFDILSGTNGSVLNSINYSGYSIITGGTFTLNKVGVDTNGILYGANLTTGVSSSSYYKLYSYGDWSQAPTVAYTSQNDPNAPLFYGGRIGDGFTLAGGGTNTLILAPEKGSNNFLLLTGTNGTTFTSTFLIVTSGLPSTPSAVQIPVAFYTNNTFLLAPDNGSGLLYLIKYPANYLSLPSPVTATVIATNNSYPAAVTYSSIAYYPSSGLLAIHGNASSYNAVYGLPSNNFSSLSLLALGTNSFTSSTTVNGNESGDVSLGGVGKTNYFFDLDTSAGVQGAVLSFVAAPIPPSIATAPTGGTVYTNLGTFTFTVSASGSSPLSYQWQYNTVSNQATATNISGATNSAYTISPLTTSASGWYDVVVHNVAGTTNSAPVQLTVTAPLSSATVTELWALPANGSEPYLDTSYNTRGLAFDLNTMNVLVAEHSAAQIYALNATNGQLNFQFTTQQTGLPAGSVFPLGQVGVSDDGVAYACNVSSYNPNSDTAVPGTSDFSITRFSSIVSPTNGDGSPNPNIYTLYPSFTGDPGNNLTSYASGQGWNYSGGDRWGDSFAIRGAGTNTQILLGTYETLSGGYGTGPGTNVAILTTDDGSNFVATTIVCFESDNSSNTPPDGFSYLGVAWGAGNTFWTKSPGYDLRQFSFNLANGTATNILNISASSISDLDGIGLDVSNNILAGVNTGDVPNDLELSVIPTSSTLTPTPYYQAFFPAYNANINGNAATTIKFPYIFSLDANNGILGLKYSVPLLPVNIGYVNNGTQLILTYQTTIGHTFQLQSTPTLAIAPAQSTWSNVGAAITATSSGTVSYTNNSISSGTGLFYRVVAH